MYRPRMTVTLPKNTNSLTENAESGDAWNGKSTAQGGSRQQRGELDLQTDGSHQGDVVIDEVVPRDSSVRAGKPFVTDRSWLPGEIHRRKKTFYTFFRIIFLHLFLYFFLNFPTFKIQNAT